MAENAKHSLLSTSYGLAPAPIAQAGFGDVLVLIEDVTLGGARFKAYEDVASAQADVTAGELSASGLKAVQTALAQSPRPTQVLIGNVDVTASTETYPEAYQACLDAGATPFIVAAETRTAAEQEALAAALLNDRVFYALQTSDVDWLTATPPTGASGAYEDIASQENVFICFHPTDSEFYDVGMAAARTVYDLDQRSNGWQGPINGVAAYPDDSVTVAQRTQAYTNNVNLLLEAGPESFYTSKGVTLQGRQINTLVSVFWFLTRLEARLLKLKIDFDTRGRKIPVSAAGQALVQREIEAQYDIGVAGEHFKAGQLLLTFPDPIDQADIDAGVIKTSNFRITTLQNAQSFELFAEFTRDDVIVEEA